MKEKMSFVRPCLNIASDGVDVTCDGRLFQKSAPETGKACLPTVERLKSGTATINLSINPEALSRPSIANSRLNCMLW